jgi:hypothetical protein
VGTTIILAQAKAEENSPLNKYWVHVEKI